MADVDAEQGAPEPPGEARPARRASAAVALGAVAGIALLVAGVLVAWTRTTAAGATQDHLAYVVEEEVPTVLADGQPPAQVPPALAGAVEAPIVVARSLDEMPADVTACFQELEDPRLETALLTPSAVEAIAVGTFSDEMPEGPDFEGGTMREGCTAVRDPAARAEVTTFVQPTGGPTTVLHSCCDATGRSMSQAFIEVPEGTGWVVQDLGAYRLALPAAGESAVLLSWRFDEGWLSSGPQGSRVLLVAPDGDVLGDEVLR